MIAGLFLFLPNHVLHSLCIDIEKTKESTSGSEFRVAIFDVREQRFRHLGYYTFTPGSEEIDVKFGGSALFTLRDNGGYQLDGNLFTVFDNTIKEYGHIIRTSGNTLFSSPHLREKNILSTSSGTSPRTGIEIRRILTRSGSFSDPETFYFQRITAGTSPINIDFKTQDPREKGRLGELATELTMKVFGYHRLPSQNSSNQGFDGVWVDRKTDGSWLFLTESKCRNESKSAETYFKEELSYDKILDRLKKIESVATSGQASGTHSIIKKFIDDHAKNDDPMDEGKRIEIFLHRIRFNGKAEIHIQSFQRDAYNIRKFAKKSSNQDSCSMISLDTVQAGEFMGSLHAKATSSTVARMAQSIQQKLSTTSTSSFVAPAPQIPTSGVKRERSDERDSMEPAEKKRSMGGQTRIPSFAVPASRTTTVGAKLERSSERAPEEPANKRPDTVGRGGTSSSGIQGEERGSSASAPSRITSIEQIKVSFQNAEELYWKAKSGQESSLNELKMKANRGDNYAKIYIALLHNSGCKGLPEDQEEAEDGFRELKGWIKEKAKQEIPHAQALLGIMHHRGLGIEEENEEKAARLYRLAAEKGYARAQNDLGLMYENGEGGLVQDDEKARKWYLRAANQGFVLAQHNLALLYEEEGDLDEAERWYCLAADQGDVDAQHSLALLYEEEGDLDKAVKWYRRAADQGNADAQYRLGLMHEQGRGGLVRDKTEALRFYGLAAAQDHENAEKRLSRLRSLSCNKVELTMNQVARVIKLIYNWSGMRRYVANGFDGYSQNKIAEILGISSKAVQTLLDGGDSRKWEYVIPYINSDEMVDINFPELTEEQLDKIKDILYG